VHEALTLDQPPLLQVAVYVPLYPVPLGETLTELPLAVAGTLYVQPPEVAVVAVQLTTGAAHPSQGLAAFHTVPLGQPIPACAEMPPVPVAAVALPVEVVPTVEVGWDACEATAADAAA
jgi:hypothetical protein